ncbi:MAG: MBOAT family protein [Candidatus Caenarcaniphilales bacterium]|nr:MBOAT family protein [Candidatus Caenarcaniphilales bacterium]
MGAYQPSNIFVVLVGLFILGLNILLGYKIAQIKDLKFARLIAWVHVIASFLLVNSLTFDQPYGFRMLGILGTLLYSSKGIVFVEEKATGKCELSFFQWICFSMFWFGMRPKLFLDLGKDKLDNADKLIWIGIRRIFIGVLFIFASWWISKYLEIYLGHIVDAEEVALIISVSMLIGFSLILHFGIINVVAGFWRYFGVDCHKLFRDPLRSKSLSEFWGRRWNMAFVGLIVIGLYRPLSIRIGTSSASFVSFLAAGLLHELAISVPVNAGYGYPTLYFMLQGLLVAFEKYMEKTNRRIDRQESVNFIWALLSVILLLPILFHGPFVRGVVWPIINYQGP